MEIMEHLAQDRWIGQIEFSVESRELDREVARMRVRDGARNPFGTVHAGAMIWLADITATLCAMGNPENIAEEHKGFPLAIDLHSVLTGNVREGELTATSTTVKRGKKLIIVCTEVRDSFGRLLVDMTTTHLPFRDSVVPMELCHRHRIRDRLCHIRLPDLDASKCRTSSSVPPGSSPSRVSMA